MVVTPSMYRKFIRYARKTANRDRRWAAEICAREVITEMLERLVVRRPELQHELPEALDAAIDRFHRRVRAYAPSPWNSLEHCDRWVRVIARYSLADREASREEASEVSGLLADAALRDPVDVVAAREELDFILKRLSRLSETNPRRYSSEVIQLFLLLIEGTVSYQDVADQLGMTYISAYRLIQTILDYLQRGDSHGQ